jgi:hypothetical protein
MKRQQQRRSTRQNARAAKTPATAPRRHAPWRPSPLHRRLIRLVRRRPVAVAAGLVTVHVALALLTFDPTPHTGGDNGAYITLGRSLLETGTYTELWEPHPTPHTKYPPVFPAVLALAMAAGLQPWVQLKLVVLGFSAVAVTFTFLWLRARRRAALALGVGCLLAVAPGVLREGRWILADVPFWAFTMLAMWAFQRYRPQDRATLAVATAATLLAFFTRSAGLPLVLAAAAWLALRRRYHALAGFAGVIGVPALVWWLRTRAYGPSGYVSEFWLVNPYLPALGTIGAGDLVERIGTNIAKYTSIHLPILLTGGTGTILTVLAAVILLSAAAGWIARVRKPGVAELFLPIYLGLILIWPDVWSGERFLLPALPFILACAAEAAARAGRRIHPGGAFHAPAMAGALLLVLALPGLATSIRNGVTCTARYLDGHRYPCLPSQAHAEIFDAAEVARRALPADAVMLNRKPRLFYVLSGGIRGINYPMSDDPAVFFAAADSVGARYLLFDRTALADLYLRAVVVQRAPAFCVMRAWPHGTVLFGILPGGADLPDPDPADAQGAALRFDFCPAEYWLSPDAQRQFGGIAARVAPRRSRPAPPSGTPPVPAPPAARPAPPSGTVAG